VSRGALTFGVRSYLEATPVELVVYVVQRWMATAKKSKPQAWDITAGGGTVKDVITGIYHGTVAATDIALDTGATIHGDLEDIGRHPLHAQARGIPGIIRARPVLVPLPDLIFIHPPSRGWPGATWLFGARVRDEIVMNLKRDLAYELNRDAYVGRLVKAIRVGLRRLATGGLLSLLVPEYVRFHQRITPDPGIAGAIVRSLGTDAVVLERHEVVDVRPVRQASMDRARGPLVHVIVTKPEDFA
jgi:hypothetical protein